ncbi:MAG TPA: carboxypeptidase-like regulatory domain-containing protein, partial [Candidatus Obscuribacter sp.]|nr:carboxypeptidase-like regulatory domain-containing protein [Candidatus Obscuribacter sp.]
MSSGEPRVKNFLDTALAALFTWEFLILQILALALVAVMLETPTGSIAGTIALEKKQFGVYSYNLKENKVYALVNGPRNGPQVERGVWVNDDGSFRIDQLPVGEYMLEVRA